MHLLLIHCNEDLCHTPDFYPVFLFWGDTLGCAQVLPLVLHTQGSLLVGSRNHIYVALEIELELAVCKASTYMLYYYSGLISLMHPSISKLKYALSFHVNNL